MGKKLEYTPNSKIKAALRMLSLRSRERAKVLKDSGYRCARCGVKKSTAKGKEVKIEIHHTGDGITMWQKIYDIIRAELLNPDKMEPLCEKCHDLETEKQRNNPAT